MSNDLIQILPHTVANQIAAGEVVQRPASMVKELMENAVDAGAHAVSVVVRDGGKSLVQVIDDGCGMAAGDAVVCFARHATSKIRESEDLFALRTFGFRGEALASIASVAEVELRTRREEDEVGTLVTIAGGTEADARTESVSCPKGTQITVRNLFFNTPARRKFLKANPTETKQVITEFQRVALCHPEMAFTLVADDKTLFSLAPGGLRQRIAAVVGRKTGDKLLDVEVDTPIVRIGGYIGLPATAKKSGGEQFFFVNGRYFRSSYLQKAVVNGYNKLLPYGYTPSYYIYIEVDPSRIDVNIHPQKTEIKFEEEQALWQMLASAVGRSLGRHNIVPMLDFDNPTPIDIPVYNPSPRRDADGSGSGIGSGRRMPPPPPAATRDDYNPFRSYDRKEWDTPATTDFGMGGRSGSARAAFEDPEQAPFTEMIPPDLLIPDFSGTINGKLRVNITPVNSNRHADMYGGMRPLDKNEIAYMQASVEKIYDKFTGIVSEGRDMSVPSVDAIAQGRVWAGAEAIKIGLVDQIGTIEDAIAYAAMSIEDVSSPADVQIVEYPKPMSTFEILLDSLTGEQSIAAGTPFEGLEKAIRNSKTSCSGKAYARMPYEIIIK